MGDIDSYKLQDVEVDTVGFVTRGANGKKIFLTKSEEENMEQNSNVQAPAVDEEKITEVAKKAAEEAVTATSENAVLAALRKLFGATNGDNDDNNNTDEPTTVVVIPDEIQKKLDAVDNLVKSHQETAEKLEKAEIELEKARSASQHKEFLAKANEMKYVPGDREEIAKFMAFLSKSDAERLEWFDTFIKGVDAQMAEAGIWAEFGKSHSPEQSDDPVEAIMKANPELSIREAYLKLGEDSGAATNLLKDRRKEVRGG